MVLAIPSSAVVEANGKQIVYVQSGDAYQPVELTLGQNFGDMIEVKTGLFDGDLVVTQRATQLYAQSLRGGSNSKAGEEKKQAPLGAKEAKNNSLLMPWWLVGAVGGAGIAMAAFMAGMFWSNRRTSGTGAITSLSFANASVASSNNGHSHHVSVKDFHAGTPSADQSSESVDNHHLNTQESQATSQK